MEKKAKRSSTDITKKNVSSNDSDYFKKMILHVQNLPLTWKTKPFVKSGYRFNIGCNACLYSIIRRDHNDFFEIWSDLLPLIFFLVFSIHELSGTRYYRQSPIEKILELGVYI